ncbi:hypothetical protein RQP50_02300 [Paenibacillus sp. chi10]|uniref:Uncharacterized protein n=1 Tax=Paenibacillus suaedae TaxID=3077233 RepID=A0AAJ2JQV2_9BACL|nr:hypothetical protein [Paenibacillus sp. chi10]MDT8975071.1 hypothetical protein [Paenibacillus sp. chi10]
MGKKCIVIIMGIMLLSQLLSVDGIAVFAMDSTRTVPELRQKNGQANYIYDSNNRIIEMPFRKWGMDLIQRFFYDANGNMVNKHIELNDIERFEHGSYQNTDYTGQKLTNNSNYVIEGAYSAYGTAEGSVDWNEFLHSDRSKIKFEPNTTYSITFKYKILSKPEKDGYFYFLVRSANMDYINDKAFTKLQDYDDGTINTTTITFTTASVDNYYLIWGQRYGGAITIDNIRIKKETESFEGDKLEDTAYKTGGPLGATVTTDPNQVISGGKSILGRAPRSEEWNEFLHSDFKKAYFEPNTTYSVTFKYKIIDLPDKEGYFYFLARAFGQDYANDKSFTTWKGQVGDVEETTITFTTGPFEQYYLIWGQRFGGAIAIDDITITKLNNSFESGTFLASDFVAGYRNIGRITNDPSKVITGKYSALGISSPNEEWNEYLHTDLNKIAFQPNTTYSISFSYKIINKIDNKDGYFYFLARAAYKSFTDDKAFTTWNEESGNVRTKTITFTTGSHSDYYLIWGIRHGGEISIDDIKISKK